MKDLQNKVAVVTGVASGIGKALAIALAKEGCHLVINDYNSEGLKQTEADLPLKSGQKVLSRAFDVSDRNAVEALAKEVESEFGAAHLVINNAGVTLSNSVEDTSYRDFEWVMNINFWGMVYGTKAFLPLLKAQPEAAVANVSSVFGLIGFPGQGAYCSSKFAIRGFTESLRTEAMQEFPHVTIHTIHPGGIDTNIVRNARWGRVISDEEKELIIQESKQNLITPTADMAAAIIRGVKRKKLRILYGYNSGKIDRIVRLFPSRYAKMLIEGLAKQASQFIKNSQKKT